MQITNSPNRPTIAQAISLLLLVFLLMLLSSLIITLALGVDLSKPSVITPNQLAITIFCSMLISYGVLKVISNHYYKNNFLSLLTIQINYLVISLFLGFITAVAVLKLQQWYPASSEIETSIANALNGDWWALFLVYISVIIIAPIAEEYLFRGILFDSLYPRFGLSVAIGSSAVIFTLFHLFEYHQYWVAWFAVFCLAVMLAFIRYKSQSMLNPIALHATYNATLLILGSN